MVAMAAPGTRTRAVPVDEIDGIDFIDSIQKGG